MYYAVVADGNTFDSGWACFKVIEMDEKPEDGDAAGLGFCRSFTIRQHAENLCKYKNEANRRAPKKYS